MQENQKVLATATRVALAKTGVKGKDFASASQITHSYLSRIMGGKTDVKISTVGRMAEAAGMKVSEFIALGEE